MSIRDRVVYLWGTPPPADPDKMASRVRSALGITRPEGFRLVRDPWGNRVKVSLQHIIDHIARSRDETRWFFIPATIPTIKRATDLYWRQPDPDKGEKEDTYTYEATINVHWPSEPPRAKKPMSFFLPAGPEDLRTADNSAAAVSKVRYMRTLYPAGTEGRVKTARKRAGTSLVTRSNPSESAYIGTRDPGRPSQAAQRLPGAAPALQGDYTTPRLGPLLIICGAIALVAHLRDRQQPAGRPQ